MLPSSSSCSLYSIVSSLWLPGGSSLQVEGSTAVVYRELEGVDWLHWRWGETKVQTEGSVHSHEHWMMLNWTYWAGLDRPWVCDIFFTLYSFEDSWHTYKYYGKETKSNFFGTTSTNWHLIREIINTLRSPRFSDLCCWGSRSSELWRCVACWLVPTFQRNK